MTHGVYKHLARSIAWYLTFVLSLGLHTLSLTPSDFIRPVHATGEKMILMWDTALGGGTLPTNWSDASGTYGGLFPQGLPVADAGNSSTPQHTHGAGTVAFGDASSPTVTTRTQSADVPFANAPHGHTISTFTMDPTTILPVYRNLIPITYDLGIPTTIPQYALTIFDSAPGGIAGWSSYTSQNGYMIRFDSTSGGTGGSTTHTHSNFTIVSGISDSNTSGNADSATSPAHSTHTHSYGPTPSPVSTDHTPPHNEVLMGYPTSGGVSIPTGMIAMFDGNPNIDSSNWTLISEVDDDYYGRYMEAQSSFQLGQGGSNHNHSLSVTSSTYTAGPLGATKNPSSTQINSHSHSISGNFNPGLNEPPFIAVVVAEKATASSLSVVAPADVTLTSGNPSQTIETTFDTDELVTVTDGGSGWSLTVQMQTTLSDGGVNTIPDANVYIRKDGIVSGGSDIFTIWSGTTSNVSESNEIVSLDTSRTVGTRSSGSGGETTNVRPSIRVIIPPLQATGDYAGTLRFTVV